MEMMKGGIVACLVVVVMAGLLKSASCHKPVMHRVGGSKNDGWREHYDYKQWSMQERFYVGDWLYFGYDKYIYTVLEVTKRAYNECDDNDIIRNLTRSGHDVVNLSDAKHYYFISSGGYCWHGMKLEVRVLDNNRGHHHNGCLSKISGSLNPLAIALAISLAFAASIFTF